MQIAIISEGPSSGLFGREHYSQFDVIIGTREAACRHYCDWWVVCDWHVYIQRDRVKGHPRLFLSDQALFRIDEEYPNALPASGIDAASTIDMPTALAEKFQHYSGLLALGLAWHLRPTRVTTFGMDMVYMSADEAQAAGVPFMRWSEEGTIWHEMLNALRRGDTDFEIVRAE